MCNISYNKFDSDCNTLSIVKQVEIISPPLRNRIIFVLSIAGILMAIYVLQSFLRNTGIVCATGGCETVRKSTYAWPLGIPIPAVGLVGYTILTVSAFLRTMQLSPSRRRLVKRVMLGMAIFGVLFVSWFTYTELFLIKGVCMWCAISAIDMYIIFFLLITERGTTSA